MTDPKKRILLVEDDLYTRDLYNETLLGAGFDVSTAVDGLQGLEKIQEGGFDLILLDAMMPKMDGLAVLSRLKQFPPKKANGPIVMSTNLARDAVLNQAMAAGAKACLIKTELNPDQMIEKVKALMN